MAERSAAISSPPAPTHHLRGATLSAAAACYVLDRMDAPCSSPSGRERISPSRIEALDLPCLGATGAWADDRHRRGGERTNKGAGRQADPERPAGPTAGPGLRLLPLVITQEEMDKGLAILKAALS